MAHMLARPAGQDRDGYLGQMQSARECSSLSSRDVNSEKSVNLVHLEHQRAHPHRAAQTYLSARRPSMETSSYCTTGTAEMTKCHLGRMKILSITAGPSLHCEDPEWDL